MSKMSNIEEDEDEYNDDDEDGIVDFDNNENNDNIEEIENTNNNIDEDIENIEENNLTELVVLDPDHILMKRFQTALNTMLVQQLERIKLEDRETAEDLRKHRSEHVEAGNELYTVQQELAKFQSILDSLHDEYVNARFGREDTERALQTAKLEYLKVKSELEAEMVKMKEMRLEMDSIALRLYYLRSAEEDIKGDIAVMKRAAEKAVEDLHKAEREKMHQDFLLDGLVNEVARLKEEISLYEAQLVAQNDEKCAAKRTVHEAQNEIQSIILERKQLMTKWNSSLIDLTRRNEAFCSLNDALAEKKEQILVLENEIEGYRRTTRKEQDVNERLTLIFKKSEIDITNLKKQIEESKTKHEIMKLNYHKSIDVLHQTELLLVDVMKEKKDQNLITEQSHKQIEDLYKLKNELEDRVTEELRSKLTLKSAAHYLEKQTKRTRDQSRQLESQVVLLANVESKNYLKLAELKAEVSEMEKYLRITEGEIKEKNDTINKLEIEMGRSKTSIERRQDSIDKLNKQLELLLQCRGGVEVGPLEITIVHLNKNVQSAYDEVSDLEQEWLRKQHEIVKLFNDKEVVNEVITRLKQQLFLLVQKKLRIEGYITLENVQKGDIEKNLLQIQNSMVKVNKLIFREKDAKSNLENLNGFRETDFIRELKEHEIETINLQNKIQEIERQKDRYLSDIVENQWQVMMFEKKIQFIQEAQMTITSDLGQGEIKSMKSEIHRMEVRYKQLVLQQEYLIQDMEKSVVKRDIITKRGESLEKIPNKVTTKGVLERTIVQIKRKIKQVVENAQTCEDRTADCRIQLKELIEKVAEQQDINNAKKRDLANINIHLDEICNSKYSQLMELQQKQQFYKHYADLKDRKYTKLCKTSTGLEREKSTQCERMQTLLMIIDRLISQFPQTQLSLFSSRQMIQRNLNDLN